MKDAETNMENADADPAENAEPLTPEQIADLQEQLAKAKDNWVRTAADFENFKKRAARERVEAIQFANVALIQKLLPILDNFEMAQAAAQNSKDEKVSSLQSGVAMIQKQLKDALVEAGVEEIDATGKSFDPALHEAISQQETKDVPEGNVIQQVRKGYKLRDRLLRPAAVIVAKKPAK
ncbi:MAG TPA: nucleotide exchange factor GrpE [Candidatus Baltobacteraceae bacterium]|nr:nucleotide exchange factor GrpE [Candidatus Baltobacteraceae bacterium]